MPEPIHPAPFTIPLPTAAPPDSIPRAAFDDVLYSPRGERYQCASFGALYRGEEGGMRVQFGIFVQSDFLQLLLGEDFFVHGAEAHEDGLHVTDDVIRGVAVRSHTAFAPRNVSDCARMQACR